jgi:acetoin utilization deacetylase AcuC-like enzyme
MVVDIVFETPSPRKPLEVVHQWRDRYSIEIKDFPPLTMEDFQLAHKKEHVEGIVNLTIANGMDTKHQEVVDSLYWTTASFFTAAEFALTHEVAVSPTSGFHHAGHAYSWGFCTFNGLLIAAIKLLNSQRVGKVGIIDFDFHQGDGSQDIIDKLDLGSRVIHRTGKSHYTREKQAFFNELPALLDSLKGVDILFYQAGADQHEDDPLGGFLNDQELRKRDRMVFEFAKSNKIPIVWNLAGGYQEEVVGDVRSIQKVLNIHNATMEECMNVYGDSHRE